MGVAAQIEYNDEGEVVGVRVAAGGREWESNPSRAALRPLLDLKSSRPTGDALFRSHFT